MDFHPDQIPREYRARDQWLHWDASSDTPRRPHWNGDFSISWSDPDDWHSFTDAIKLAAKHDSWGVGYVCARNNDNYDGEYAVIDIDGAITPDEHRPHDWLPKLDDFIDADAYIEVSPSENGLHIPTTSDVPEWWRDAELEDEHQGVEVLANKFCTFTGNTLDISGTTIYDGDLESWLTRAYLAIKGQLPPNHPATTNQPASRRYSDDELIEDALEAIDPDVSYSDWRNIGFALHDHFDGSQEGKRLFESWSRSGSKYDEQAQEYIDRIWNDATTGGGRSAGTVFWLAKNEYGWSKPKPPAQTNGGVQTAPRPDEAPTPQIRDDTKWDVLRDEYASIEDMGDRKYARWTAADVINNDREFLTHEESDTMYVYNPSNGAFEPRGEAHIQKTLANHLRQFNSRAETGEITHHVRGLTYSRPKEFGGEPWKINVKNGVLDLETGELLDHDPAYRFLSWMPVEYDPDAECPRWLEFLDTAISVPSDRRKLQEYAGYTLHHWGLPHHKALFIVGPTASGKSTFLDTIRSLLGPETVSSVTPHELVEERFAAVELFGAWANIRNDIPANLIENTGKFKELVAGDPIKAERKHEPMFTFDPLAKHLYSANQLPDASVDDEAFYRRILLISFPSTVPIPDRDPRLGEKLQRELPGILNWAIDGFDRLMKNGEFSEARSPGEIRETWESWSNSLGRFKAQALTKVPDGYVPKDVCHDAYVRFCEDNGLPSMTQNKMTRSFKGDSDIGEARKTIDGGRKRCYTGVELKPEYHPDNSNNEEEEGVPDQMLDEFGTKT